MSDSHHGVLSEILILFPYHRQEVPKSKILNLNDVSTRLSGFMHSASARERKIIYHFHKSAAEDDCEKGGSTLSAAAATQPWDACT